MGGCETQRGGHMVMGPIGEYHLFGSPSGSKSRMERGGEKKNRNHQ